MNYFNWGYTIQSVLPFPHILVKFVHYLTLSHPKIFIQLTPSLFPLYNHPFPEMFKQMISNNKGFPGGSDSKESACNMGDPGSIPGSESYPLEKGMATHSSILAFRLSWTEEPGGLHSIGSQKRHD